MNVLCLHKSIYSNLTFHPVLNQCGIYSLSWSDELTGHLIDPMIWLVGHLFVRRLSPSPFAEGHHSLCSLPPRVLASGSPWQGAEARAGKCPGCLSLCSGPLLSVHPWVKSLTGHDSPLVPPAYPPTRLCHRLWSYSSTSLEGFPLQSVDLGLWQDTDRLGRLIQSVLIGPQCTASVWVTDEKRLWKEWGSQIENIRIDYPKYLTFLPLLCVFLCGK